MISDFFMILPGLGRQGGRSSGNCPGRFLNPVRPWTGGEVVYDGSEIYKYRTNLQYSYLLNLFANTV